MSRDSMRSWTSSFSLGATREPPPTRIPQTPQLAAKLVFSLRSYWAGVTHPTNTSYYHCWVWGDVCGAAKHTGGANPNYPDNLPKE